MNNAIKKLIKFTKIIDGWLSIQEGLFLYKLASRINNDGVIVEIGSWQGKSTIWLASAIRDKKNAKIYAVDPHTGSPEITKEFGKVDTYKTFLKNIKQAGLSSKVIPIRKPSLEAVKDFIEKADIIFIDGSHRFADARADFLHWKVYLKKGGWLVLHDATVLPGPWKVAKKYLLRSSKFSRTGMLGSMIYGKYTPSFSIKSNFIIKTKNIFSYLFIISYVSMRKIPGVPLLKKRISKLYFKRKIAEI